MVTFALSIKRAFMQGKKNIAKLIADIANPYRWITALRNYAFDKGWIKSTAFDVPIICIGNITVGGTGKTPHTEYLVRLLEKSGKVAVLSRGYGRKSKGYIMSDEKSPMSLIGDEPHQIKTKFPLSGVAVCEKRVTGVQNILAERKETSVILLDDAFQHRHIKAGLYILLVDSNRPIWNDCVLPFGRLRESDNGAKRADIVILTKCSENISREFMDNCKAHLKTKKGVPVFFSKMVYGKPYHIFEPQRHAVIEKGRNVLLLTGIAKPEPLKKEIESRGANVTLVQYADHHNFTTKDIEEIARRFNRLEGEKLIITTEKDATRLREIQNLPASIKESIYAMPIEIKIIDEEAKFNQIITDYVTKNKRNR